MRPDFTKVTELPRSMASREQLARLHQRYRLARRYSGGKRVLEVGCGAGLGLGYLAATASRVVGGDCTLPLLAAAQAHYAGRVPLVSLDAQHLPFGDEAFDVVVVFEAIYYFPDAAQFAAEAFRVLHADGLLLIGSVNRDWPEFAPSPFSTRYFSAAGLQEQLERCGFGNTRWYAGFPIQTVGLTGHLLAVTRRVAVALHLLPGSLAGRARLKRLLYGRLFPIPAEIDDDIPGGLPDPIPQAEWLAQGAPDVRHKIFYCVARRR